LLTNRFGPSHGQNGDHAAGAGRARLIRSLLVKILTKPSPKKSASNTVQCEAGECARVDGQPDVDGALVGGASLEARSLLTL